MQDGLTAFSGRLPRGGRAHAYEQPVSPPCTTTGKHRRRFRRVDQIAQRYTDLWNQCDRGRFDADACTLFHGDASHIVAVGELGELQHGE